jgi:hypothetical protein
MFGGKKIPLVIAKILLVATKILLVAMSRRNQQKKNSVGRNKNSVGRSKNCIGRDKDFKFRICILSHSGLDRTLYIVHPYIPVEWQSESCGIFNR